jgi:RHS repeat-associated protein
MLCQNGWARVLALKGLLAAVPFLLIGAGAAFYLAPADAATATAAGRTKGSFVVSPTGAATYTIPIWAPPGPQGLQPNIALSYNSQQGNGYVGVGWSVSGLSSIYRCNLTYAQDAAPAPVALVTGDGYCMDGQRLRLTSTGNYGEAGSTYLTEIANFVNVTAYGTAGNGPAYFIAQDRNGRTYTYGNGGSSQVLATGSATAISWMLNEVSDPFGNTMTIAYNTTTGSPPCITTGNLPSGLAVPCTISWTPTSHEASTYSYTMSFSYGTNVLPPQGYVGGTSFENANLLSSIAIAYSGTAVKTYYLTYTQQSQTTGTGRDVLTQVQECAGSGTSTCLSPTVITYQGGTAGVSTTATSALSYATSLAHYDFNGDGYPDLLYNNGTDWYVAFGSSSGYGAPVSTGVPSSASQVLAGDLLGNGQDGILAAISGTWYYYTWNGSSFTHVGAGLAYDSTATQYMLVDVNGNGLPALVASYYTSSGGQMTFTIDIHLNTGGGNSVSFGSAIQAYTITSTRLAGAPQLVSNTDNAGGQTLALGKLRRFDFNGDGRDDLAMQWILGSPGCFNGGSCTWTAYTYEVLAGGSTSSPTFTPTTSIYSANDDTALPVTFLDFNSDACTDYLIGGTIYVAGCNGTTPSTITLGNSNVIGAMDWNGDGLTDILVANGSTVGVYLSTGRGVSNLVSTSIPYSTNNVYFTLDANGDGLDDLGYWTTGHTYYYLHNGAGTPPDLVSSVTDGFGNSASPTYASIVQGYYTEDVSYTTPKYPDSSYIGPMYVVNEVTFSDPSSSSGGTYQQQMYYYAAWVNLQGRGFDGFVATRAYDTRNALYHSQYYLTVFPYTGIKYQDISQVSGSQYLTEGTYTYTNTELETTAYEQRYFPYPSSLIQYAWEYGGSENNQLITTASTNYTYDNYGNPTSIATTVTDNDPGSPYKTDTWTTTTTNTPDESTNPYCLSLFSQTQVAYTASSGSTVTTTKTLTPNFTDCRYTQIVTQSNSGSAYAVTEALAYDSFGNVNSDKVTGANMTARTTTASWTSSTATTGQFPMSVTDPSGATTNFNYNFSYGLKSSTTDPNVLTTSWQYDGFGRKTQETRPDGTYTTWTYYNCTSYIGCPLGSNGLNVLHDVYSTNASVQSYGIDFLDAIDRRLVNIQIMMNGTTYARNELRYDSLGRVSERAFPCTYSAITTTCTYWTTNTYDVLNRLTESQRPISSTNSNLQTTTYAYAGRTTTVTDALSNTKTIVKDVNGWLRQSEDPYGYKVTLAYDAAGNKTAVIDSLSNSLWSATYNYGIAAFPATVTDMDMGSWSFTYNALGEKTAWKDAKSQSFSATYDVLSRPLTRTEPDLFTQWTWGSSAASYNVGKLQSVCTGTGNNPTSCSNTPGYAESETYDSLSRPSTRAITIPGQSSTFTYTWAYNATTGLLNTLTYPASHPSTYALELQYGYSSGLLQTVTDISDTPNVAVWQANTTNPVSQITEETLGNGIVTNRSYDAVTSWLGTAQSGVGGGSAVKNLAFLFDEMGDVTQRQDNNLGLTENLYYDNDYRLTSSTLGGTQNLAVTYDNTMGNITSRSDIASGATWTYSSTQKHAVTQAGSSSYQYAYDANGNATSRQGDSITWSSYNYPITVNAGSGSTAETVAFEYGPGRQRWQQAYTGNSTTETTNYIGRLEMVVNGSVIDYRHYIYGGTGIVAVYSRKSSGTNTFSYILSDHQASAASITNSSGAQVVGESFTAFGNRRNPATWSGADTNTDLTTIAGITREGYTFQTALGLWMGMNHMNGRVQDAVIGRMLSADPYVPDLANTQSYNRFSYVNNNPLSFVDPSGFDDECDNCIKDDGGGGGDPGDGGDGDGDGSYSGTDIPWVPDNKQPPGSIWQECITSQGVQNCTNYYNPLMLSFYWGGGGASGGSNGGGGGAVPTQIPCRIGVQCMANAPPAPSKPPGNPATPNNPCSSAGGAPTPQQYAAQGQQSLQQLQQLVAVDNGSGGPASAGLLLDLGNLLSFGRGGSLDAQASGSSPAYANYAFGVYMAASGWSLSGTLSGANLYASAASSYPSNVQMSPNYPSTPNANITNITAGYNAQTAGSTCQIGQ